MAVLMRWTLGVAIACTALAGCVFEPRCVAEGARRGPDGRCTTAAPRDGGGGTDAGVDAGTPRDSGGPGVDAGTPRDSGGPGVDAGGDGGMCDVSEYVGGRSNRCTSPADMAALERSDYGDGGTATLRDLSFGCAVGCLGSGDRESCVAECVRTASADAVSLECAACYGASVECTIAHCFSECATAPESADCLACHCGVDGCTDCYAVFEQCSGAGGTLCDDVSTRE